MKVLCIDASAVTKNWYTFLKEGKIYDAEPTSNHCGKASYEIGWDKEPTVCGCGALNNGCIYRASRFVPLSNIDEKELLQKRQKEYETTF